MEIIQIKRLNEDRKMSKLKQLVIKCGTTYTLASPADIEGMLRVALPSARAKSPNSFPGTTFGASKRVGSSRRVTSLQLTELQHFPSTM